MNQYALVSGSGGGGGESTYEEDDDPAVLTDTDRDTTGQRTEEGQEYLDALYEAEGSPNVQTIGSPTPEDELLVDVDDLDDGEIDFDLNDQAVGADRSTQAPTPDEVQGDTTYEEMRDTATGYLGEVPGSDTAQEFGSATDNVVGGFFRTNWEIGRGIGDVAQGEQTIPEASANVGEEVVGVMTDDPEAWRDDFWESQAEKGHDLEEDRQDIQESLDEGGAWGNLAATGTAVEVGHEAIFDNPEGSIQDGTSTGLQTLLRQDDEEDLAETFEAGFEQYDSATSGAIDAAPGDSTSSLLDLGKEMIVDPTVRGVPTGLTGVNPETGETDARTDPLDFYPAAFDVVGAGQIGRGTARWISGRTPDSLSTGSPGGSTDDLVEQSARQQEQPTGSASTTSPDGSSPSPTPDGTDATRLGGGVAGTVSSIMPRGISDFLRGASRSDELATATRADPPARQTDVSGVQTTDLGGTQRSIGSTTDTRQFGEDFRGVDEAFGGSPRSDDVIDMGRAEDGVFRQDESTLSQVGDALPGGGGGGVLARTGDDLPARRIDDEPTAVGSPTDASRTTTTGSVDDTVSQTVTSRIDEAIPDSVSGLTARGGDEGSSLFGGTTRSGDEGSSVFGGTTRQADEATTTRPRDPDGSPRDTSGSPRDPDGSPRDGMLGGSPTDFNIGSRLGGWWGRRSRLTQGVLGAFGLSATADLLGVDPFGGLTSLMPGSEDGIPPGGDDGVYRAEQIDVIEYEGIPVAGIFEIFEAESQDDWASLGYAATVADPVEYENEEIVVLDTSGRETPADPLVNQPGVVVTQPRFNSRGQAEDAVDAYIDWLLEQGEPPDDTEDDRPDDHPNLEGSLDAPGAVGQGQAFDAEYSAELTGNQEAIAGRAVLALDTGEGILPLAESDLNITSGGGSASGVWQVPQGWTPVVPDDYELIGVIAEASDEAVFASTSITVEEDGPGPGTDDAEDDPEWAEAEPVRDLPGGWVLFQQERIDGDEVRFMVAGLNENDEEIYIQPAGEVDTEPHFFPTAEEAAQAHAAWVEAVEDGRKGSEDIPDPSRGRPSPGGVTRDTRRSDEQGRPPSGLLDRAARFSRQNPILATAIAGTALIGGYWLYANGYFDKAIQTVKNGLGRITP